MPEHRISWMRFLNDYSTVETHSRASLQRTFSVVGAIHESLLRANKLNPPKKHGCLIFDWGDTLMRDDPQAAGPMSTWKHVEAIPHAVQALTILRSNWIIALATNAVDSNETDIRSALQRVGLNAFIDKIYCFKRIGHKKPSKEFFKYVLEDLKMDCSQVVMIGDSFKNDVLGANEAGIRAIWFNPQSIENNTGRMYQTIHSLDELPIMLDSH
jgi:HAD superfamily hydrolase (TIGR01509 family)